MQTIRKTVQKENCNGLTQSCPAKTDLEKRTTMCKISLKLISKDFACDLYSYSCRICGTKFYILKRAVYHGQCHGNLDTMTEPLTIL